MKTTLIVCVLGFSLSSHAGTLFDQLRAFNPNWKYYSKHVPAESERIFLTDKQYIQAHLELALGVLKRADVSHLTKAQLTMRVHLITVLSDYRMQGSFPKNYYCPERIPVFIDEHQTHCAVGYLMQQTGYENLAQSISKADNYIWVKDLKDQRVIEWQQLSGFSLEELKLIQGAYDSYMPFALEAPNRIEIPQKPEVIALNFKAQDLDESDLKTGRSKIWIRGEGKKGVLHGRWEQNYSPTLPWIVGFYQNGNREGKWLEYYQGTNNLCRTEHWKNDKLNGIRTRFDRSGDVIEEIMFENGNAVLKTNYDLGQQLKYVRKPLGDNKVWTEIYDLGGQLIASGHETIHNPGNLQWFQNIELTALNTMSLASQTYTSQVTLNGTPDSRSNSVSGSPRLYDEPPLVEYIKQGDWSYYKDSKNIPVPNLTALEPFHGDQFSNGSFSRLGAEILPLGTLLEVTKDLPEFDSLQVNFSDGNANWLNGYNQQGRSRIEFQWFTEFLTSYLPVSSYDFYGLQRYNAWSQLKSYGFVNENDERINKWYYFDEYGQLSKVEEFVKPEKKDVE